MVQLAPDRTCERCVKPSEPPLYDTDSTVVDSPRLLPVMTTTPPPTVGREPAGVVTVSGHTTEQGPSNTGLKIIRYRH